MDVSVAGEERGCVLHQILEKIHELGAGEKKHSLARSAQEALKCRAGGQCGICLRTVLAVCLRDR